MKAIMYHYARHSHKNFPYFRYLSVENFCKQLDFFEKTFGFVRREDFLNLAHDTSGFENLKNKILLTFDDGFIDHYSFVLPELLKRKLFGLFFIPTGVYGRQKALDVHRIHYLLGMGGGGQMLKYAKEALKNFGDTALVESSDTIENFKQKTYKGQSNDSATTEFKKLFNYYIKYEYREQILDEIVAHFVDDREIFDNLYMSVENLKTMQDSGMIVGSHSVDHLVFSKLTESEQTRQIVQSFDFLQNILGDMPIKTFCYPYGGFHTFNDFTEQTLSACGCTFAFNVESRDVTLSDIKNRPQALPRYDCNEFAFGKASLDAY